MVNNYTMHISTGYKWGSTSQPYDYETLSTRDMIASTTNRPLAIRAESVDMKEDSYKSVLLADIYIVA